jgi:hypothetical protein
MAVAVLSQVAICGQKGNAVMCSLRQFLPFPVISNPVFASSVALLQQLSEFSYCSLAERLHTDYRCKGVEVFLGARLLTFAFMYKCSVSLSGGATHTCRVLEFSSSRVQGPATHGHSCWSNNHGS